MYKENIYNLHTQQFQPLGEMWSYYIGKWFLSHYFVFRCSGKQKLGQNARMTYYFILYGCHLHRASL